MKREEYRAILSRLPIKNPTPQDMAMLCPHLTKDEAVKAFKTGAGYVACPPLRIRNAFQIVYYYPEYVEEIKVWAVVDGKETQVVKGTKNHPAHLGYGFAGRTRRSYADGKKHGDVFARYRAMKEAMQFAEANWGEDLVLDNWVDVCEFIIQDPTDLVNDKYHNNQPRTKAVLTVGLIRNPNVPVGDCAKPASEQFDDAVVEMTLDLAVGYELRGGRGTATYYNCAHCGHGLLLDACAGCGHCFEDNKARFGWATPLSPKMVEFLRKNGHEFGIDPARAWADERRRWGEGH